MGSELTMTSRAEVTMKFAQDYARGSKRDKSRMLDPVVVGAGWFRDNARRRLTAAAKAPSRWDETVAARSRGHLDVRQYAGVGSFELC